MSSPADFATRWLIIPDVHQAVAWVERILAAHGDVDRVIFLGDYFDTNFAGRASVAETCELLLEIRRQWGNRVTFLLGNHDIQYLEAKAILDRRKTPRFLNYQCGSAYSPATAKKVAKGLPLAFWDEARLFLLAGGVLASHAGVAAAFWPEAVSVEASLKKLGDDCTYALRFLGGRVASPLLLPGIPRGGDQKVGGLTWLDWDYEFDSEAVPLPQVVGHSRSPLGARSKGTSWCLDGVQTTYATLEKGRLKVHEI